VDIVSEVRQFNRFYSRQIGLLDEHMPGSTLSLPEGRVIYELAITGKQTAAEISRTLGIDKAQLSRVVRRLTERGLVTSAVDRAHAKRRILALTKAGRRTFGELDQGTRDRMDAILEPIAAGERGDLVGAMRHIQQLFGTSQGVVTLRALVPGDIGWVIHRQAVLYTREYGWDWTYEALMAGILGEYVTRFDATKDDGWIAEQGGRIVGSIFLVRSDDPAVAKLRLLYVEPAARGAGIGRTLVETCIDRARELGYRRLTLWTNDVLVAARRIYETAGFRLVDETPHHSFGHDLVGQTWELTL
jgi:DNA-binding MarR family transcriptional regulator/GNAT superfamily N-acetyltransferase